MNQVQIVTTFMIWIPTSPSSAMSSLQQRFYKSAEHANLYPIQIGPGYFACTGGAITRGTTHFLDVFGADAQQIADNHTGFDLSRGTTYFPQFYNTITFTQDAVAILSDPLAVKSYYYTQISTGVAVGSSPEHIFLLAPEVVKTRDKIGIAQLLLFRTPYSGRTYHEHLKRSAPGITFYCERGAKLLISKKRQIGIPPSANSASVSTLAKRWVDGLRESISTIAAKRNQPVMISLSGGFDSRLLAAVCKDLGIEFSAFCYGRPGQREVRIARRVARTLGVPIELWRFPDNHIEDQLPIFIERCHGLQDVAIVQIANILQAIPNTSGRLVLHGFLGDVLGGSNLEKLGEGALLSKDALTEEILRYFVDPVWNRLELTTGLNVFRDDIAHSIYTSFSEEGNNLQRFLLWDIEGRQASAVASHFRVLCPDLSVAAPFFTETLIGLSLSASELQLRNRAVTREAFKTFYPKLAKIPHADENVAISPQFSDMMLTRMLWLANKADGMILGKNGLRVVKKLKRIRGKEEFWGVAGGVLERTELRKRAVALAPSAEKRFGIHFEWVNNNDNDAQLSLIRLSLALGAYAQWVDRTIKTATTDS